MVYDNNPPSYDYATQDAGTIAPHPTGKVPHGDKSDVRKHDAAPPPLPTLQAGPSYGPLHGTMVHHYVNPHTGEHVTSVLPPDHPEMRCLQEGRHIKRTRFGLLGVLAAIIWFPLGVGLCLLDRRVRCERCGYILEDGIMCG